VLAIGQINHYLLRHLANTLQQAGFLRYSRGHIRILNLEGLQETACECYQTVKSQADRLLGRGNADIHIASSK
jgi:hypothetical protein